MGLERDREERQWWLTQGMASAFSRSLCKLLLQMLFPNHHTLLATQQGLYWLFIVLFWVLSFCSSLSNSHTNLYDLLIHIWRYLWAYYTESLSREKHVLVDFLFFLPPLSFSLIARQRGCYKLFAELMIWELCLAKCQPEHKSNQNKCSGNKQCQTECTNLKQKRSERKSTTSQ